MIAFFNVIENNEDKNVFILLYEKYKNLVIWIALKHLGNNMHLAEECLQETFMYIAKNFSKISDIESPSTKKYIATIADAFAIKIYHKENKFDIADCEYELENPDNKFDFNSFETIELKSAIDNLPERERSFLWLKYIYGYKSKEIAEIYDISDALVRKTIQLAKMHLKKIMKGDGFDESF